MGFLFRIFCSVILALGIGYYSARWAIYEISAAQSIANGPWRVNPNIGSAEIDPYTKAFVAKTAFLALNKSEAIYFFAEADDEGQPFSGRCTYVVSGGKLPSRWWTITAYGADHYLMDNGENRYAVSSDDFGDGGFSFTVSQNNPRSGAWLPIGETESFSLTLRAYNPNATLLDNLAAASLPKIRKEGCS